MLTEASKKHSGLLQSAQEELTKKDALIQELHHEVRGRGSITQDGNGGGGSRAALWLSYEVPALGNSPHSEKQASRVCSWALNRLLLCVQACMAVLLPTLDP